MLLEPTQVRLPTVDKQWLAQEAKALGISVPEYMRRIISNERLRSEREREKRQLNLSLKEEATAGA